MGDGRSPRRLDRRDFLRGVASASVAAFLAACAGPSLKTPRPAVIAPSHASPGTANVVAPPSAPTAAAAAGSAGPARSVATALPPTGVRTLYRGAALASGRSATLETGVSILVADGRILWIRPTDSEEDPGAATGLEIVDSRGATIVPGLVDAHSHVVLPGGVDYLERIHDSPRILAAVAERNGLLAWRAGVRWLRDVGSPLGVDPFDHRRRALALGVRDRWQGKANRPHVKAAGTWIASPAGRPAGSGLAVAKASGLPAAALGQIRAGADFVKLYVETPGIGTPWTAAQIARVVKAVHAAGFRVAAHVTDIVAARAAVGGGVDAIEHGFSIDTALARTMARKGTVLVTTIAVPKAWIAFAKSSPHSRFGTAAARASSERLLREAIASARIAHKAGVKIATGTDFGGGGPRAGVLAGEVQSLVEAGMQPWEALGSATWRGGELLGEPDAGVVREGGPAEFILVKGDPLSDPSVLRKIWRSA